jgi:outer membrane protein OmpA-like peptidoglycan-associated protein
VRPTIRASLWLALASTAGCGHLPPPRDLRLDRVVLYQNGVGHFERRGLVHGNHLRLLLRPHEVDDVIKTLTVLDVHGAAQQVAAALPTPTSGDGDVALDVTLSRPDREVQVSYAVPTATWKTTYRLALPSERGKPVVLQAWAMIDNVSDEPWRDVRLSLATGAPLSYATDLRTPHFVPRPDATGALIVPTARGVVGAETARGGDHDGVAVAEDRCPDAAEDRDGFEDSDGCPDLDNDQDKIPDVDDKCPNEPETYNGFDDEDGCPDRGRVIVTDASIQILDKIYFGPGVTVPPPAAGPLLDAVAQTLIGNPQIRRLEIQGHAAKDEADPWGLSAARAGAVKGALVARGVHQTLDVVPYGDTMPVGDAAQSRRAEFQILDRKDDAPTASDAGPRIDAAALAASGPARASTVEVAGATRFELVDRVTVPRNASTLVSVLSRELTGDDALLFRPDPAVPGSELHPFRAARIELPDDIALEPGPVAVYADGSFAGEGLATRTHARETTYVPFAVDGGTTVNVVASGAERPARLVAISRGVAVVENAIVRTTRYEIHAGARVPARIYLRHVPATGFTMGALPPDTERGATALLVPVPMVGGRDQTLVIEERQPVERRIEILSEQGASLTAYLAGSDLPAAALARAQEVIAARAALATIDTALAGQREALAAAYERSGELEQSLTAVAKLPGPEAAALRKRLLTELDRTTARAADLARTLAAAGATRLEATIKVQTAIEALTLDAPAP